MYRVREQASSYAKAFSTLLVVATITSFMKAINLRRLSRFHNANGLYHRVPVRPVQVTQKKKKKKSITIAITVTENVIEIYSSVMDYLPTLPFVQLFFLKLLLR